MTVYSDVPGPLGGHCTKTCWSHTASPHTRLLCRPPLGPTWQVAIRPQPGLLAMPQLESKTVPRDRESPKSEISSARLHRVTPALGKGTQVGGSKALGPLAPSQEGGPELRRAPPLSQAGVRVCGQGGAAHLFWGARGAQLPRLQLLSSSRSSPGPARSREPAERQRATNTALQRTRTRTGSQRRGCRRQGFA